MKKCFISIALIISCFFICSNLNAETYTINETINFDDNSKFNYFYEMKYNTAFYQYLTTNSIDSILSTLGYSVNFVNYPNPQILISYPTSSILSSYPNTKYVLYVLYDTTYSYASGSNFKGLDFEYDSTTSTFHFSSSIPYTQNYKYFYYMFDENANLIDYQIGGSYSKIIDLFSQNFTFTHFLSAYYYDYCNDKKYITEADDFYNVRVTDIFKDDINYNIEGYKTVNSFKQWWNGIVNLFSNSVDSKSLGLSYFVNNYYSNKKLEHKTISVLELMSFGNRSVPPGYDMLDFTNVAYSVLMIPKTINSLKKDDYILYGLSNDVVEINSIFTYDLSDVTTLYDANYLFYDTFTFTNTLSYYTNYAQKTGVEYSETLNSDNYINYAGLYIKPKQYFSNPILYYNSSAWTVYIFSQPSSSNTIILDSEGNTMTKNALELEEYLLTNYEYWQEHNTLGISCPTILVEDGVTYTTYYDSVTQKCINASIKDLMNPLSGYWADNRVPYVLDENGNAVEANLDLTSILSGAWDGAKTFISAGYKIVSLSTSMFLLLPNEISAIITCAFTIGTIILIFKLFH